MSRRRVTPEPDAFVHTWIEVPRAMLEEASALSWPDLMSMAGEAGWRLQRGADIHWCRDDHALLRDGLDRMKGTPVLAYQKW